MFSALQQFGNALNIWAKRIAREEKGDFGVRQLAITVGIVIVIGVAVTAITGTWLFSAVVEPVWKWFFEGVIQPIFDKAFPQ